MIQANADGASGDQDQPEEMIVLELCSEDEVVRECDHEYANAPNDRNNTYIYICSIGKINGQIRWILYHAQAQAKDNIPKQVLPIPYSIDSKILIIPEEATILIVFNRTDQMMN